MGALGLLIISIGLMFIVWLVFAPLRNKNKRPDTAGLTTAGQIVYQKEWLHEGHRRCQVEYTYSVSDPETGESKTLRGKSNCVPDIFDQLELNSPIKVRYLPQKPEFSRPIFD